MNSHLPLLAGGGHTNNMDHLYSIKSTTANNLVLLPSSSSTTSVSLQQQQNNNMMPAASINSSSSTERELAALAKENGQLKCLLSLHLDLIQEQSDMLLARDKQIAALKQENEVLKLKTERLERRIHAKAVSPRGQDENIDINTLPVVLSPGNKSLNIQTLSGNNNSSNFKTQSPGSINLAPKATQRMSTGSVGPNKSFKFVMQSFKPGQVAPEPEKSNGFLAKPKLEFKLSRPIIGDEKSTFLPLDCVAVDGGSSDMGSSNKITLQKADSSTTSLDFGIDLLPQQIRLEIDDDLEEPVQLDSSSSSSNSSTGYELEKVLEVKEKSPVLIQNALISKIPDQFVENAKTNLNLEKPVNEPVLFDRRKEVVHEDLINAPSSSVIPSTSSEELPQIVSGKKKRTISESSSSKGKKYSRIMTTDQIYITRHWEQCEEDEEITPVPKSELGVIPEEDPNLEVPSWKEIRDSDVELSAGEEHHPLDDDPETYLKRHQKYELDERRRKKWDVQRFREQRTIERLKRRHCKFDAANMAGGSKTGPEDISTTPSSLFPNPNQIKYVEITTELPIQAFGECVPNLHPLEFNLPWGRDSSSHLIELNSPGGGDEPKPSSFLVRNSQRMMNNKLFKYKRIKPPCSTNR